MTMEPFFTQEEQAETVRELQDGLRLLSQLYPSVPHIAVDGIYGMDTKLAVAAFQKEAGLEATGTADYETWNAVIQKAEQLRAAREPARPVAVFQPPSLVVGPRETGDIVLFIQIMLRSVSEYYSNIGLVSVDGIYGSQTADSVRRVQKIADIEETGCVDKMTWGALTNLYEHISGCTLNPVITKKIMA